MLDEFIYSLDPLVVLAHRIRAPVGISGWVWVFAALGTLWYLQGHFRYGEQTTFYRTCAHSYIIANHTMRTQYFLGTEGKL